MLKIFGKIQSSYGVIKKMRHYLTNKHLLILFYSMIHNHINYCLTTWCHGNKTISDKILKICDKFIKLFYTSSTKHKGPIKFG